MEAQVQALVAQVTQLTQQLATAEANVAQAQAQADAATAAAAAASSGGTTQVPRASTVSVDTRVLGKPESFDGTATKWRD